MTRRAARPRALATAVAIASSSLVACGGGAPLLHPAQTMASGDFRLVTGVAANVATGALGQDLSRARELVARDPQVVSTPTTAPDYAKGALVAASIAPGLSPVVGARVGVGSGYEAGLAYTGRAVRLDVRRAFVDGPWALSVGVGGSAALYGRQQGTPLPDVDLGALKGYGVDVPVLVGWESAGGLYSVYAGPRAGYEHAAIKTLSTEPRDVVLAGSALRLDVDRFYGGGVLGFATGFKHVHVALELGAAYQIASGSFAGTEATVRGLTLTPASAIWTTF